MAWILPLQLPHWLQFRHLYQEKATSVKKKKRQVGTSSWRNMRLGTRALHWFFHARTKEMQLQVSFHRSSSPWSRWMSPRLRARWTCRRCYERHLPSACLRHCRFHLFHQVTLVSRVHRVHPNFILLGSLRIFCSFCWPWGHLTASWAWWLGLLFDRRQTFVLYQQTFISRWVLSLYDDYGPSWLPFKV